MYTLVTLKIEQARANCAIFMLLSRFVCSSESDESGIVIQRSGITLLSALQLHLPKSHLIQSKFPSKLLFCRQVRWMECRVKHIRQKSSPNTPLILGIVLRAQSIPLYLFQHMTESWVCSLR